MLQSNVFKRTFSIFCCIILTTLSACYTLGIKNTVYAQGEAESKNLIVNGDFSQHGSFNKSDGTGVTFSVNGWKLENAALYDNNGDNYVDVWGTSMGISQAVDLEPKTCYCLTYSAAAKDGDAKTVNNAVVVTDKQGNLLGGNSVIRKNFYDTADIYFKTGTDAAGTVIKIIKANGLNTLVKNVALYKSEEVSEDANLLVNGDAELGNVTGWSNSKNSYQSIYSINSSLIDPISGVNTVSKAHQEYFSGQMNKRYFYIYFTYNTVSQQVTLEPNCVYTLSMDYYNAANHGTKASVKLKTANGAEPIAKEFDANYRWESFSQTFTTGEGNTEAIISIYGGTNNYFAFDNVRIIKTSRLNYLDNGNFSQYGTDIHFDIPGWNCRQAENNVGARMEDETNGIYLDVWQGNTIWQTVDLEPESEYTLTFSARKKEAKGIGNVSILETSGNALASVTIGVTEWKDFSVTFKTGEITQGISVALNGRGVNLYVKNMKLAPVSNYLLNGDFSEHGEWNGDHTFTVKEWTVSNSVGALMKETDGNIYLDVWGSKSVAQTVNLNCNSDYVLRFNAKRSKTYGYGIVSVRDKNGKEIAAYKVDTDNYADHSLAFETGADASGITVVLSNAGGTNLFIRNISLTDSATQAKPQSKDCLTNGDFSEHGDLGGGYTFSVYGWSVSNSVAALMKDKNGVIYLDVWGSKTVYQTVSLLPETKYILKINAKRSLTYGSGIVSVKDKSGVAIATLYIESNDYSDFALKFTTGVETEGIQVCLSNMGGTNLYVKNISLKVDDGTTEPEQKEDKTVITDFSSKNLYAFQNAQNLIESGDFESVPTTGWNNSAFIDSGIASVSNEKYRSGKSSIKIQYNGSEEKSAVMWTDVEPNTDYIFQLSLCGEFMSESNLADMSIQLIEQDGTEGISTGNELMSGIVPPRWDSRWHRRAVSFRTGETDRIGIKIAAKSAYCYIDDMVVCKVAYSSTKPQENDINLDSALAAQLFNPAFAISTSTDIVTCDSSKNLIFNGEFNEISSWDAILKDKNFTVNTDEKDVSNQVLKYRNPNGNNHYILKWIDVKPNTKYAAYIRMRGEIEGEAAFTILSELTRPVRLAKYAPDRFDGVWQTFSVIFNSSDSRSIGIGFIDSGKGFSADDIVLCEYADAHFEKAPDLPPIGGDPDKKPDIVSDSSDASGSEQTYTTYDDLKEDQPESEKNPVRVQKKGKKGKTVYTDIEVVDWVTQGIIIGSVAVGVIGASIFIIVLIKKKRKQNLIKNDGRES